MSLSLFVLVVAVDHIPVEIALDGHVDLEFRLEAIGVLEPKCGYLVGVVPVLGLGVQKMTGRQGYIDD